MQAAGVFIFGEGRNSDHRFGPSPCLGDQIESGNGTVGYYYVLFFYFVSTGE